MERIGVRDILMGVGCYGGMAATLIGVLMITNTWVGGVMALGGMLIDGFCMYVQWVWDERERKKL